MKEKQKKTRKHPTKQITTIFYWSKYKRYGWAIGLGSIATGQVANKPSCREYRTGHFESDRNHINSPTIKQAHESTKLREKNNDDLFI